MNVAMMVFGQILGLDICRDTIVGDEMQRGISGGQKKRVTTGLHLRLFNLYYLYNYNLDLRSAMGRV